MPQPLRSDDPTTLGGHRLLGRLGSGGQGVVYLGEATDGTRVAVKTLNTDGEEGADFRRRFAQEARAARQVASFCTAAVLDVDTDADPPYIVSEYVEGPSLQQAVSRDGPLTGGDLHRVAVTTATALMAIHKAGIVHRDFKPSNVLLGSDGVRVIDFGVARLSQSTGTLTTSPIGTPGYMAPEQITGGETGPTSDMFAWGEVMLFAATGHHPFTGENAWTVMYRVLHDEPDLDGVPEELRPLVAAALDKDPQQRPSSTDALMRLVGRDGEPADETAARAMREAADTANVPAASPRTHPTSALSAPAKRSRRSRPLLAAGIAAVLAVLAAGALAGWFLLPRNSGGDADGGPTAGGESPTGERRAGASPPPGETPDEGPPAPGRDGTVPGGAGSPAPGGDGADPVTFPGGFTGSWTGTSGDGLEWRTTIADGAETTVLRSSECSYEIALTEPVNEMYRADVALGDDSPNGGQLCGADAAQVRLEDNTLHMVLRRSGQLQPVRTVRMHHG